MTLTLDTNKQENLSVAPPEPTMQEAALFLESLVESHDFLRSWILPLLEEAERQEEWYVAYRHDTPGYSLQVFVWPPGSTTRIHDHSCWGAFCCVVGSILEERYTRLDDGSRREHARLRKSWQLSWSRGDEVSTVLPYGGGIHRIGNPGGQTAISVHLYGPRIGEVDGRDYDISREYVCDRVAAESS